VCSIILAVFEFNGRARETTKSAFGADIFTIGHALFQLEYKLLLDCARDACVYLFILMTNRIIHSIGGTNCDVT
jgi:hypothetical protein